MTDIPNLSNEQGSQTFKVGIIDNAQDVSFQVKEVNNIDATHIKISEDRLALILERNKDKIKRSTDDYDSWPWVSLFATALFNIATCVPIAISSTFKGGWGRVFDVIAVLSVLWLVYVGTKAFAEYEEKKKREGSFISIDELLDVIKKVKSDK